MFKLFISCLIFTFINGAISIVVNINGDSWFDIFALLGTFATIIVFYMVCCAEWKSRFPDDDIEL